jgi:hypothetical protein
LEAEIANISLLAILLTGPFDCFSAGIAMTINQLEEALLWCVGINYALLLIWAGIFVYAHDWMYRIHTRWFRLSFETFDTLHYAGLTIYKLGIILLNLVPLVALYLSSWPSVSWYLTAVLRAGGMSALEGFRNDYPDISRKV